MAKQVIATCPLCDWTKKVDERDERIVVGRHVHKSHSRSTAPDRFSDTAGGGRRRGAMPTLEDHDRLDR